MTTIRIGFPLVLPGNAVVAVWVSTQPITGRPGRVFWNDDQLNAYQPFSSTELSDASAGLALHHDVYFRCSSSDVRPTLEGTIELTGRSFGLALALAQHFRLPRALTADVHLLLSGVIDTVTGQPRAIGQPSHLSLKVGFAQERGYALLLLPDDAAGYPPLRLPNLLPYIAQSIKETQKGCIFTLPIERGSYWEASETAWWAALGEALNLEPITGQAPHMQVDDDINPARAGVEPDSIGTLFHAALSTHGEYFQQLLAREPSYLRQNLFEIGRATVAKSDEVFYRRNERVVHRNILLAGPTASGKTSVAEALILNAALEGSTRVLYIAPTRSLANERYDQIRTRFCTIDSTLSDKDVVLSTGEEIYNDWRLTDGRFRIAVLVNEKANLFLRPSRRLLSIVGLVVIDELHMLAEPMRGGVLDLMIAKIKYENVNRSLAQSGSPALRLAVVTTEARLLEQIQGFFDTPTTKTPVVLRSTVRPLPVRHLAHVYGFSMWRRDPVEIVQFSDERDRLLEPVRQRAVADALRKELGALELQAETRTQHTPGDFGRVGLSFILEHYSSAQQPFTTVLVAHPSIEGVRGLAQRLAETRAEAGISVDVPEDLLALLAAAPPSVESVLLPLAERGIYLHHSELRRDLREWVEKFFRRQESRPDAPRVIFATETLFYGVNLTVDCVILTSPHWTREILSDSPGELSTVPLTATEFHNVLGRAGRPGRTQAGVIPTAVVCFPAVVYCTGRDDVDVAIQRYYSETPLNPDMPTMFSRLFGWRDVIEQEKKTNLAEISFPTFRGVMDALRFTAPREGPATVANVQDLLGQTVFGASAADTPLRAWRGLVKKTLGFAVSSGLADEASPDVYRIRAEAEALIDTGTKWQSVAPMQRWLETLLSLDADSIPVELLIPAFVSTPELWVPARTFCWESAQSFAPRTQVRQSNAQFTRMLLLSELALLGLDASTCEQIEAALHSFVGDVERYLPLKVVEYRHAVFYRLTSGFLRWVRGADEDSITELSLRTIPEDEAERLQQLVKAGRSFREQYRDRANWLAMMCGRFFERKRMLRREHRRELPALGQRLRLGVPARGIPLIAEARRSITRRQVVNLLSKDVDPLSILRSAVPTEVVRDAAPVGTEPVEIVDSVYRFYASETQKLAGELRSPEIEVQWQSAIEACTALTVGRAAGTGVGRATRTHLNQLKEALARLAIAGRSEVISASEHTIRITNGGSEVVFKMAGFFDTVESNGSIVVRMPWPQSSEPGSIEVTAIGGSVLIYLVAREFITIGDLETWVSANRGLKSIRDFIEDFVEELYVPTLPSEVHETLLGFNEPGVAN